MDLDRLLPEDHHHHQYGGSKHTAHPLDDILGPASHNQSDNTVFVYVGPGRGRYEESTRGNFHYVGPCKGHFEKECQPPDYTARNCFIGCCCLVFVIIILCVMHTLAEEAPFDCRADINNWEMDWSEMKKEWCCANEGIGCPGDEGQSLVPPGMPTEPEEPMWLLEWLPDLSIGAKFCLTMVLALICGCCGGASLLYIWVRYFHKPKPSKTELELVSEINKMLEKAQKPVKGNEIQISMMWDTSDDLDLHLTLPDHRGEVFTENKEVGGFVMDVDANEMFLDGKRKLTDKPLENISFTLDPENPSHTPPPGEYTVWLKVYQKREHHKIANVTITLTISGKREVFHRRVLPGVETMKICTFTYLGPAKPGTHAHGPNAHGNHHYH